MRQFRNKGWDQFEKMQAIIPLGGARGRHAFYPGGMAPPIVNTDNEPGGTSNAVVAAGAATIPHHNTATSSATSAIASSSATSAIASSSATSGIASSTAASSNAGKRPYAEALTDIETASFGSSHMSMQPPSTTLVVSAPPSKKARTPAQSQNSRHAKISSIAKAAKITPAAAVVGMQGSINRMTDVFETFMRGGTGAADDPVTRAVAILEGEDADIPVDQQALLISVIGEKGNEHFLKFYITMNDGVRRRAFVEKMIGQPVPKFVGQQDHTAPQADEMMG
jgi:hypothetical protein